MKNNIKQKVLKLVKIETFPKIMAGERVKFQLREIVTECLYENFIITILLLYTLVELHKNDKIIL